MGKRLKSYRIDEALDDAVAAEAAKRGETVTDMIVRASEAYIRGEDVYTPEPPDIQPEGLPGAVVYTPGEIGEYPEPRRSPKRPDEPEGAASIAAFFS